MLTMRLWGFFLCYMLLGTSAYAANAPCLDKEVLRPRTVMVEEYSRGVGSGVLYDANHVLTTYHVVQNIEKIWVRLPGHLLPVQAALLRYDAAADVALLALARPVGKVEPLPVVNRLERGEELVLAAFVNGNPRQFDVVGGTYIDIAQLPNGPRTANSIVLESRAYVGDSGGGVYTCDGALAGLGFGNRTNENRPGHALAVQPGMIQLLLMYGQKLPEGPILSVDSPARLAE
jgi:hypothetical protein